MNPLPGVEIDAVTYASLSYLDDQAGYRQNLAIAEGVELLHASVVTLAAGGGPVRLPYPRRLPHGAPVVLTMKAWRGPRRWWRTQLIISLTLLLGLAVGAVLFQTEGFAR